MGMWEVALACLPRTLRGCPSIGLPPVSRSHNARFAGLCGQMRRMYRPGPWTTGTAVIAGQGCVTLCWAKQWVEEAGSTAVRVHKSVAHPCPWLREQLSWWCARNVSRDWSKWQHRGIVCIQRDSVHGLRVSSSICRTCRHVKVRLPTKCACLVCTSTGPAESQCTVAQCVTEVPHEVLGLLSCVRCAV